MRELTRAGESALRLRLRGRGRGRTRRLYVLRNQAVMRLHSDRVGSLAVISAGGGGVAGSVGRACAGRGTASRVWAVRSCRTGVLGSEGAGTGGVGETETGAVAWASAAGSGWDGGSGPEGVAAEGVGEAVSGSRGT